MDNTLIVAVIAATGAAVGAIISLTSAVLTNRLSNKAASSVELLKQHFSASTKTNEIVDRALAESLDALRQGMQVIQNMKDEIQLVLSSVEGSLSSSEALSRMTKARDLLLSTFQATHPSFSDAETKALHRAKGLAIELCRDVQVDLRGKENASALSDTARMMLIDLRARLTEEQNMLRDSRTDRLVRRTIHSD